MGSAERPTTDPRRDALIELYAAACAAVDGRRVVRAALAGSAATDLRPIALIAVGKAAAAMTLGALDAFGERIGGGLLITAAGHLDEALSSVPGLQCLEADHPVPGSRSFIAGQALLDYARALPSGMRVIVLVSGGASSLVEVLAPGISAAQLARLNEWGLGAGLSIGELNALRRRVSQLKDGRLARALRHTSAEALLMSDVPGDDPAVIGSGLVRAAAVAPLPSPLPAWVGAMLDQAGDLPTGAALPARVVATLGDALDAVVRGGAARGYRVRRLVPGASGDVALAASRFAHELALSDTDLLVWGGETSVRLPDRPGRGGRNQQFALTVARLIAGHEDLVVLAAGTDGTDGNSTDAGAIVDGSTVARGVAEGLASDAALAAADAGGFLEAAGDLLHTGPTGTNVCDLMLGLRWAPPPPQTPMTAD